MIAPTAPAVASTAAVDPALVERVRTALAATGGAPTAARVAAILRSLPGLRSDADALAVVLTLRSELAGAGPLQALLVDAAVTDVLVQNGGEVWVDRGDGLALSAVRLRGETEVRRLAVHLVAGVGRRLDAGQPWADATLPDGHRVHAVIPPVAVGGTCLSIRALRPARHTLSSLTASGALPASLQGWLAAILTARLAAVVTGATGAGKTTLLGALLGALDPGLRIVVVEDATELAPIHPHVVRLQARPPNVEGAGAVPLRDLVRQALRMRPDRLVLGEVRGPEVVDLLVALNTGHEGSLSTLHANSTAEVPARLEALGALAGLARDSVHSLMAPALQAAIHVRHDPGRGRSVAEVGVFDRDPTGMVTCRPALRCRGEHGVRAVEAGPGFAALRQLLASRGVPPPAEPTA